MIMGEKILVVEDDKKIQELIVEFLLEQNYIVDYADDGILGYEKYEANQYDLLILDVMMPHLDGYNLCNLIRSKDKNTPIIFLTALSEEDDEIKGFDMGADDFITKPFSFNILTRRVEAALKRNVNRISNYDVIKFKELKLDLRRYKVFEEDKNVELTLKEFNILKMLIINYPRVVTRENIIEKVWQYNYFDDTRVIDAHVKNLRKKLKNDYIRTVKGIGYVLE